VADFLHDKININTLNYNHESRLHEIVKNNLNVNLIDIYIYYKIDINLKNKNYLTPIELAIMLKRYEHIERLLFYNCKVDHDILKLAHEYDIPFPLIHNIRTMISF
jgi:hypothetical protein